MHLRVFGCKCYVHNNGKDGFGKFDPRSDEAIFLWYSSHSKTYKVFNKRTLYFEESVHVFIEPVFIRHKVLMITNTNAIYLSVLIKQASYSVCATLKLRDESYSRTG